MYSNKKKRHFTRDSYSSSGIRVLLIPRDDEQLSRTLSLEGVVGDKPCINDVVGATMARLEAEYMNNAVREYMNWANMVYSCMGEDRLPFDDDDDLEGYEFDEKGCMILNPKKRKRHARREYRKSEKRSRARHHYDEDETYEAPVQVIKYYPDVENELSVIEFNSLKEFENFCDKSGIVVNTVDYSRLLRENEVHCCLDPIDMDYGDKVLITDTSYGGLYWTVSEDVNKYSTVGD